MTKADYVDDAKEMYPWKVGGVKAKHYSFQRDTSIKSEGLASARITNNTVVYGYGSICRYEDAEKFQNTRVRITAAVRTEIAQREGWAGLAGWSKVGRRVEDYQSMHDRKIRDTTDWTDYSITVDVPKDAWRLAFGVMLSGVGKVWIDNVRWELVDTLDKSERVLFGHFAKPYNSDFEESITRKKRE